MTTARQIVSFKTLAIGFAGIAALVAITLFASQSNAASEAVLVRGIVKSGGDKNSINLYITNVTTSADASKIQGKRTDVDTATAKKYRWEVKSNGALVKVRTASNPTEGQEVALKGHLLDDGRIKADWTVVNYRKFMILGTLQNRTLDTNKTDEGYVTVNVTSTVLKDVKPARAFKSETWKGKDVKFRVEESTSVNSLGKSKSFEDVNAGQQKVRLEGEIQDNGTLLLTKLIELN